ncbi:MAG: thioredoxin [Bacteroidaceae bacterium]|nr:thioredoxin [Bacteroidaceae bacterium]
MRRITIFISLFFALFAFSGNLSAQIPHASLESKTIKLNKAAFLKKVVNFEKSPTVWNYLGDKPAIIDFYADWCGPCRRLAPVLDELAAEYAGKIYIYKVNVDNEKEIAEAFGITSLPTIVFVPMKGNPSAGTGFLPKETLRGAIKDLLLDKGAGKK